MIQESVKYKELFNITLVVKNDPYDDDGFDSGTYTVDFQNSIYIIRGDSMIIETVEDLIAKIESSLRLEIKSPSYKKNRKRKWYS